ncbi:molybdopterin synthase catalytic subunit MoaE [Candidatus Endoriftia persephonae]|jgi:molybdopterin synthase catalytic subunit|uniref:Molybdopterin synthase catalytic subunit n=2 Tax=Gammaproteobacteria TaxID=1236 RepID=G2FFZ3_9GAMM|nr:molybdopterin synthase catalytic subunit MoaE [Candidatus Endoriftia persephone]EGW54226.1 molybdopterin synthase catalytic subunit [endosymbiont of Tevnia jerichonana (vent Tica)]USF87474.1 molybdopterin synthase catalytic subunit MoaE [Candidatus Endoriftia persephone]
MNEIRVQSEPFDPNVEVDLLRNHSPSIGGVVSFIGQMRDFNDDDMVLAMTLEHYPGMTEKALAAIVDEANARWELMGVRVVHRVGRMLPKDPIVLVAVASSHRGEAFQACEFIIDYLKTRAPFWKREESVEGARWVDARESDDHAEARWKG